MPVLVLVLVLVLSTCTHTVCESDVLQHIRTHSVFVSGGTSPPNAWDRLGGRLAAVGKLAMSARANGAGAAARAGGEALPWCHISHARSTWTGRTHGRSARPRCEAGRGRPLGGTCDAGIKNQCDAVILKLNVEK